MAEVAAVECFIPYEIYELAKVAVDVGGLTDYASVEGLYRAVHRIQVPFVLYVFALVGAFFAFIFTKSAMAISLTRNGGCASSTGAPRLP